MFNSTVFLFIVSSFIVLGDLNAWGPLNPPPKPPGPVQLPKDDFSNDDWNFNFPADWTVDSFEYVYDINQPWRWDVRWLDRIGTGFVAKSQTGNHLVIYSRFHYDIEYYGSLGIIGLTNFIHTVSKNQDIQFENFYSSGNLFYAPKGITKGICTHPILGKGRWKSVITYCKDNGESHWHFLMNINFGDDDFQETDFIMKNIIP